MGKFSWGERAGPTEIVSGIQEKDPQQYASYMYTTKK